MTFVERFIEFNSWPTSRKSALLMAMALPPHLLFALPFHLGLHSDVLREDVMRWVLDAGAIAVFACLIACGIAARRGREGRWTAYLIIALYGPWTFVLLWALGFYVTPFLAYPFLLPLLLGLWFDMRIGWASIVVGTVASLVAWWLTLAGVVSFAGGLSERSIDGMRTGAWFATVFCGLLFSVFVVYAMGFLTVGARRLQDERLSAANARLQDTQRLIRRYVPQQVADQILSGKQGAVEGTQRRKLTMFFSDLVGFTDIAEELEPEDFSRLLNEYFSEMTAIAQKHGGTVDELSGDAILIFFGAPAATDDKDHALRAARMALDMQQAMTRLNSRWRAAGITEVLQVRMGINTGVVTIGNFGSPDRMKYAALGKHVNVAARLQARCEPGRVLISHSTWLLVNDQIPCAVKGELQLKGIHKPVMTYELLAP